MMFKPLTATHGQALLMSYLEAFRAKTSQSRGGGAGIDGERSGMWREMARIIHEVRPGFVFVENSPMLTSRGLGTVLGDLAAMGFDAKWGVLGAADIGANHQRDRIWIVAKMADSRCELRSTGDTAELDSEKKIRPSSTVHNQPGSEGYGAKQWWQIEPSVARMGDGVAFALDRSKAIGNGQVPLCAATAWRILNEQ
jgi:DNA (cytosine-5)-methyltransferase 1